MNNFTFHNPVKILFGKGQIAQIANLVPANSRVLITYGGGTIKNNTVYDQVKNALKNFTTIEFGGIEPNPEYNTLLKAVDLCVSQKINFILAVGGGSVIDGTKFISAAVNFPLADKWQILNGKSTDIVNTIPFGTVLTLPATGSEMNGFSVISRRETNQKEAFSHPDLFPQFALLDPQVTYSLPKRQLCNGIIDPFIHVTEQYLTTNRNTPIQDGYAETILKTLIEVAPKIVSGEKDDVARCNWMWSATNALNGYIGSGVDHDWATHQIGHQLTALYGLDHAQTLAIIAPQVWRYKIKSKREKLLKFAKNVWGIDPSNLDYGDAAEQSIIKTESFFHSLGVKTKLSEYNIFPDMAKLNDHYQENVKNSLGEHKDIHTKDIISIISMAK